LHPRRERERERERERQTDRERERERSVIDNQEPALLVSKQLIM
jgi:hypothetical protein